jgi:hypothetical protein
LVAGVTIDADARAKTYEATTMRPSRRCGAAAQQHEYVPYNRFERTMSASHAPSLSAAPFGPLRMILTVRRPARDRGLDLRVVRMPRRRARDDVAVVSAPSGADPHTSVLDTARRTTLVRRRKLGYSQGLKLSVVTPA